MRTQQAVAHPCYEIVSSEKVEGRMNESILALDLGTHFGWAHHDRRGTITTGNKVLDPSIRFSAFMEWINSAICLEAVNVIAFEDVSPHAHLGGEAAHIYGGFKGILLAKTEQYCIKALPLPIGTIKKHATGSGNASKKMMVAALPAELNITDENEADAYWVLQTAIEVLENERR